MDFSKNFVLLVFDTETTGLNSIEGHRVVDFGVQVLLWKADAAAFEARGSAQWYFNPDRASEPGAAHAHRLSRKFLAAQPVAAEQVPAISAWVDCEVAKVGRECGIAGIWLAAHNAIFDVGFCNGEVLRAGLDGSFPALLRASGVLCTKQFFKKAVPSSTKFSQNGLCEWAGVDTSARHNDKGEEVHGALVDCQLLAQALVAAHQKLGTDAFSAACQKSLLDAASLASMDSLAAPSFYQRKERKPKVEKSISSAVQDAATEEVSAVDAALQALKDKCAGALADFKQKGGDISAFEAALWKRGVRLRLNFADDYRRFSGTSYTDGEQTLSGSSIGKEFSAKAIMELTGYQRLRHWSLVQHHLPLMERLRSLPLEALVPIMEIKTLPAPLPDATSLASLSLHMHFARAGAIFGRLQAGQLERTEVSAWLESLRADSATKPLGDSVALFLNGFSVAAGLHKEGVRMEDGLARLEEKFRAGAELSAIEEIALLHQGAMRLCERMLPA